MLKDCLNALLHELPKEPLPFIVDVRCTNFYRSLACLVRTRATAEPPSSSPSWSQWLLRPLPLPLRFH